MAGMRNFNFSEGEETEGDELNEERDDSEDEREYSDYDDNKDDTDFEDLLSQNEDTEVSSLQNLCLRSITSNFERFNAAYTTSEDSALRRNLVFLQRAYSDHVLKVMEGCVSDSNLNFLIHEHLKELYLEMLCSCSEEAVLKRLSEIGHGLIKGHLCYARSDFSDDGLSLVKKVVTLLPNVQVLQIPFACDDEILQLVSSNCPKLQGLYIDDSKVTDKGVKSLFAENNGVVQAKCHLTMLSLKNTKVGLPGLQALLENIPTLEILNHALLPLAIHSMHKNDVENDATKEYNLTILDLMHYEQFNDIKISDILAVCAKVCPHVSKLCSPVMNEKEDLHFISLFPNLEYLSLDSFCTTTLNLNDFLKSKGGNLKEVKLSFFSMSALTLLESCPKLEALNLKDISFVWDEAEWNGRNVWDKAKDASTEPPKSLLRKLCLEHFSFQELSIEKSVTALLYTSPKLEFLDMAHCEFDNSEMGRNLTAYCGISVLKDMQFRCCDVNAILMECILLTCSTLRMLVIHDCENIFSENIDSLYEIIHSRKSKVNIVWSDDRSDLNSIDDDFFDNYDFAEAEDSDDYYLADYDYAYPYDFDPDYPDDGSDY